MTPRPDLVAMAADIQTVRVRVTRLHECLIAARTLTVGEYDDEKDIETVPGNGDDYDTLDEAARKLSHADFALAEATVVLASQQGLREFNAAGVES